MKLHHLALSIQNVNEVSHFYEKLLGFRRIRAFSLKKELANKIFNIKKTVQVFYLEGQGINLELFITDIPIGNNYNHWCLSFPDREIFIKKAEEQNIKTIRIKRESQDLIFIKDSCGNTFEIKED